MGARRQAEHVRGSRHHVGRADPAAPLRRCCACCAAGEASPGNGSPARVGRSALRPFTGTRSASGSCGSARSDCYSARIDCEPAERCSSGRSPARSTGSTPEPSGSSGTASADLRGLSRASGARRTASGRGWIRGRSSAPAGRVPGGSRCASWKSRRIELANRRGRWWRWASLRSHAAPECRRRCRACPSGRGRNPGRLSAQPGHAASLEAERLHFARRNPPAAARHGHHGPQTCDRCVWLCTWGRDRPARASACGCAQAPPAASGRSFGLPTTDAQARAGSPLGE